MAEQLNLSRGARRCLEQLKYYARQSGRAFPFQKTLARDLKRGPRTVGRYISELVDSGAVKVIKRQHSSAEYVLSDVLFSQGRQGAKRKYGRRRNPTPAERFAVLQRDGFKCTYCGIKALEAQLVVDHVIPFSKGGETEIGNLATACVPCNCGKATKNVLSETLKMSGLDVRSKAPSISVYKTLNTEGRKLHAREAERKPVGKELIPSVSNEEYIEFCTHCARERIQVPSRFEAAQIRQRFVGTFNGRPAWLQLKPFWNQRTVGYWLLKDREQVLMEMERQLLTPPEQSKNDKRREQVLRKLMEG